MYIERNNLRTNSDLRAAARAQLKGNWGMAILVCFLSSVILCVASFLSIFIAGALELGLCIYFIRLVRNENPQLENLFDGFKNFVNSLGVYLVMVIFILLWSLLLIVPGIIAALSYSQAFFILNDNPNIGIMEALKRSKEMMQGQKGKLFLLGLSFIGWCILGMLSLGIGFLWIIPYMTATMANFYEDLKIAHEGMN